MSEKAGEVCSDTELRNYLNSRLNKSGTGWIKKKRLGIGGRDRKAIGRSVKSCEMVKPCIGVWTLHRGVGEDMKRKKGREWEREASY